MRNLDYQTIASYWMAIIALACGRLGLKPESLPGVFSRHDPAKAWNHAS